MNTLKKEFVPYEQALALKELGFDEPCFAFYQIEYVEDTPVMVDDDSQYRISGFRTCKNTELPEHYTSAPLKQQVLRWFREKYGLYSWITMELGNKSTFCWVLSGEHTSTQYAAYFKTYEEAEIACLNKLIEIVKQNK